MVLVVTNGWRQSTRRRRNQIGSQDEAGSTSGTKCKWPICGYGCSACCSVISAWGLVMLAVLGFLFSGNDNLVDPEGEMNKSDKEKTGTACYIAAGMYLATFIFSVWQFKLNTSK